MICQLWSVTRVFLTLWLVEINTLFCSIFNRLYNIHFWKLHLVLQATTACKCTWSTHPHFSPCRTKHIVQFTNIYLLCEFNRLFAAVCTTRYAIYLKPKFTEEQYNPSSAQEGAVVHSCQSLGCLSVAPTQTFETSADCKGCVCAFHQM